MCLLVHLSVGVSVSRSVCTCLSVCLSVDLTVYLPVHLLGSYTTRKSLSSVNLGFSCQGLKRFPSGEVKFKICIVEEKH